MMTAAHWGLQLVEGYKALSVRERLMLAGGAAVGLFFAIDFWLIQPQMARQQQLAAQQTLLDTEQRTLTGVLQTSSQRASTAQTDAQAERQALLASLGEAEELLRQAQANADVDASLAALSTQPAGVALLSLRVQPGLALKVEAAATSDEGAHPPPALPVLYSKPVTLDLEGSYPDLMRALARLETRPGLAWGDMTLAVQQYPRSRMTLNLRMLTESP
jgi:multidrug efflux pump subunit AcrA (membrane-fusion protein)